MLTVKCVIADIRTVSVLCNPCKSYKQKWVYKKWPRQGIQVWPDTKSGEGAVAVRFTKSGGPCVLLVSRTLWLGYATYFARFRKNRAGSILPVLDNSHPVAKKKQKKKHGFQRWNAYFNPYV